MTRDAADILQESVGFSLRSHGVAIAMLAAISLLQSIQSNLLSFVQPCVAGTFDMDLSEVAALSALSFVASAAASPIIGPFADTIGRRPACIFGLLLLAIGGLLSPMAPTFMLLCIGTAISGIGMADYMPSLCLITEVTPNEIRGRVTNATNWLWSAGTVIVVLVAWLILPSAGGGFTQAQPGETSGGAMGTDSWRVLLAIFAVPAVAGFAVALCSLRESPIWLLSMGRETEAVEVLQSYAAANGRTFQQSDLKLLRAALPPPEGSFIDELRAIWVSPPLRRRALLHALLWFLTGFSYQGVILQTTILFEGSGRAEDAETGSEETCSFDFPAELLISVAEIPGTYLVHMLIDQPCGPFGLLGGRRGLQFLPYVVTAIAGLVTGVSGLSRPVLLVAAVITRCALATASSATFVAAPELYPTKVRSTGSNLTYWLSLMGGILSAPWVYSDLSRLTKAAVLALCNLVPGLLALWLPETAGAMDDDAKQAPAEGDDAAGAELSPAEDARMLPSAAYGTFGDEAGS